MSVKNIILKLLDNQPVNVLERAELEQFDPEKLVSELDELRSRVAEAEREKLSEKEQLELDIRSVTLERDQLRESRDRLLRSQMVRELAGKHRFSDPDYLDYLAAKESVDLNDPEACSDFIERMRLAKPESFETTLKSGSGSGISSAVKSAAPADGDRIGKIISELENVSATAGMQ